MAQKMSTSIGIDFDACGIRGVKVTAVASGKNIRFAVDNVFEVRGNYGREEELIDGLKQTREKLAGTSRDHFVACVTGKQVYAAQMPFRRLPTNEMANALKFEIRKNLPFEAASATIDYQILDNKDEPAEQVSVMVTAVANPLLKKLLQIMEQAGIRPWIVDVMPVAVANTFWAGENDPVNMSANVVAHFSPEVCTLVIDGNGTPFYTRSIYFSAEEIYGKPSQPLSEPERERRVKALGEELARSLSFYEKTYNISNFGAICLMGDYIQAPDLLNLIHGRLNLRIKAPSLLQKLHSHVNAPPGKFDVAVALAMRTDIAQSTIS
jgi:type IV pilus assembly protein PilM